MTFDVQVGGRRSGKFTALMERVQAVIEAPCHACGDTGRMKGTASQAGETRYFCHSNDKSCYNDFRGRYFEDPDCPIH